MVIHVSELITRGKILTWVKMTLTRLKRGFYSEERKKRSGVFAFPFRDTCI